MTLLEVKSMFRRARFLRKLYKSGLLDVLRPWVTFEATPEAEALTEATLSFLLDMWITKPLLSNFSFNIGKSIVKVKKNGNEVNKKLAEQVQNRWTEILKAEDKPEAPEPSEEKSSHSLPYEEEFIGGDSVAMHTRSRRQATTESVYDFRKRIKVSLFL